MSGLDRRDPRVLGQAGDVGNDIRPRLPAVARDLQVPVIGAGPDYLAVTRRLREGLDRCVHLGRRVVDRDAARLLLFLFLWVVGRQIGRDTLPRLAEVL